MDEEKFIGDEEEDLFITDDADGEDDLDDDDLGDDDEEDEDEEDDFDEDLDGLLGEDDE